MARRLISSGSPLEATSGYSRAVVDGEWIFVSGTTGFDYATMQIAEGAVEQAHQTFRNIEAALRQAGASLADVVRAVYYIADEADWPVLAPVFGQYFGNVRPAATAVIARLIDPRIRIEIEVTARRAG
jgi:enamine deaminase RidA (YjgF/YER057c/UK114 family)